MGRKLTDRQVITLLKEKVLTLESTLRNEREENKQNLSETRFQLSAIQEELKTANLLNEGHRAELDRCKTYCEELERNLQRAELRLKNATDAQERYREMLRKRTDAQARMSRELYEGRRANMAATLMSTMSRHSFGDSASKRAEKAVIEADLLLHKLGMRKPQ